MSRSHGVALLISAALCSASFGAAPGQAFIVRDGQARAEIVVSEKPARMARLAAGELQTYIAKITGAELPITTKPTSGAAVQVYVGRSAHTDRLHVTDEGLGHGAFRMVSGGHWLALLGHDSDFAPREPYLRSHGDRHRLVKEWDKLTGAKWLYPHTQVYKQYSRTMGIWELDERGSLNAVYEFLRMQGVRWYLPGELGEIVPRAKSIALPRLDRLVKPDFALRYFYQYAKRFSMASKDEVLWQLRLGLNQAPDLVGLGPMGHGTILAHGRDEVKAAHPEYFALFGGRRETGGNKHGKPCLSSPGLLRDNVKLVRAIFDIHDAPLVSVMPADGYVNLCQCDLCKGKGTPKRGWSGQLSDYVWDYVDRVGREVYKTHPDKKILCFAYGAYLLPPTKINKLSPNVAVGICQGRAMFHDPERRKVIEDVRKGWLGKVTSGKLCVWEYYLHARPNRAYEAMPVFFPHAIAQDLRSLKGISMGDFIEVYRQREGVSTIAANHLNLYVTSRFHWDADQDVDAMLEEYYTSFYGPARDEMKAFIEYSEANWMDLRQRPEKIGKVLELLDKARKKAPADSVYAKRIDLIVDYTRPLNGLREQLAKGRGDVPQARAVERDDKHIRMDGKLDDEFWQGLGTYGLKELQTGREPVFRTWFKVAWAGDSMYLGITCLDRDTKTLNIGATQHGDVNVWVGDTVELLIETQAHSYYQIAISPVGAVVDADREKGIRTLWSSGIKVASHIAEGCWSLEVRLPVAGDLQAQVDPLNGVAGRRPSATYPWYFNVCRQRVRASGSEFSAFSPTGKEHFHDLMKFGKLFVK